MRITRLALFVIAVPLSGCLSYQVMADPAVVLQAAPDTTMKVRVTLRNGERFKLKAPQVDGDSLRGRSKGDSVTTVALAAVAAVEVQKTNTGRTAGAIGLGVIGLLGWFAAGVAILFGAT